MPQFLWPMFATAGLIAALGPVLIHLLNRRRYRVVEWAAMDFLRQALQRNRRMLQLRDILLLLLRTACVLLFGLALARPYWAPATAGAGGQGPLHAVLVIDNSRSMGYERINGTLLDEAKLKADEFIGRLPLGSRISVIPLCGSEAAYSLDPYRSAADAREALKKIDVVDRPGTAARAIDLAQEACQLAADLPAKRVVFLGDQQATGWPGASFEESIRKVPELQVVHLSAETTENAWIEDFRIQDGIADVETTTTFVALVRYEGAERQPDVQVTLEVDGAVIATRSIDLEPGQTRELTFPHRFDIPAEPGRPTFQTASVTIQPETIEGDRLESDNRRFLAVPIVAALPVVFVDQYGDRESPQRNEYGETFHLRRLLAPVTSRNEIPRQLVQIRHVRAEALDQSLLEDARLVVMAGVPQPGPSVPLLREFVMQGGQLVIAAGGPFDPKLWNNAAWLDGSGILPAPFAPEPLGQLPEEATGSLRPFELDVDSLTHDYFQLPDVSREELADLYRLPLFFKAVAADVSSDMTKKLLLDEQQRIEEDRKFLAESDARQKTWDAKNNQGSLTPEERQVREDDLQQRAALAPNWLLWRPDQPSEAELSALSPLRLAERMQPRVLARYTLDQRPFLISRRIGQGHVVCVTTGVYSSWNDLTKTNAALIYDRILRSMLEETLPRRSLDSAEQITIPVASGDRRIQYTLTRPSGLEETLALDALGAEQYGVTIRNVTRAGEYQVSARSESDTAAPAEVENKLWETVMVVNGSPVESDLTSLDAVTFRERIGRAPGRWIERDEPISLAGAQIYGQDAWWWLLLALLTCLLLELVVLGWPVRRAAPPPAVTGGAPMPSVTRPAPESLAANPAR